MDQAQPLLALALRAAAMGLAAVSIAVVAVGVGSLTLFVVLLGVAIFVLGLASIIEGGYRRRRVPPSVVSRPAGKRKRRR